MSTDRFAPIRAVSCRVEGKHQGSGWLVTPEAVLTCRHVVEGDEGTVVLFPWDESGNEYRQDEPRQVAEVTFAADGADLALLTLAEPAPEAAARLALRPGLPGFGERFLAWGYRQVEGGRIEGGLPAYGELAVRSADRGHASLLLQTDRIAPGMSGAPVVQDSPWRVVGLTTSGLGLGSFGGGALGLGELTRQFPALADLRLLEAGRREEEVPSEPPLRWLANARSPSEGFVGREADLLALDRSLAAGGKAVVRAAVEGLAGVGKTELALQYVYRYADPFRFPGGVLWLDASVELGGQWLELALSLGLDPRGLEADLLEREILRLLSQRRLLLLVLDNAERWDQLQKHLPKDAGHAFLVTTRERDFGGVQLHRHLPLSTLDAESARALVRTVMGERAAAHPEEVAEVVEAFAGHALALEVAAAYLRKSRHVRVARFLAKLGERKVGLPDGVSYGKTFTQMMDEVVEGLAATPGALRLFRLTGLYADALAPRALLEETWRRLKEESDFDEAWAELCDSHLVQEDEKGFWMLHRLVREEARRGEGSGEDLQAHSWSLKANMEALEEYDFAAFTGLKPHIDLLADREDGEVAARVLSSGRGFLRRLGRLPEAKDWATRALEVGLITFGEDHHAVATRRSNLATILQDLGDHAGARRETEEALRIDLTTLGPDHLNVAVDRSNLATILQDLGDHAGARRETEEALRIDLSALGPNHPNVAIDRSNLGQILQALGDLAGARRETEEALRIDLSVLGLDHPNVAIDRSNLATILQALGDLAGARRETEEALRIGLSALGPDHPDVAVRRSNLGHILLALGEASAADREAREAVRIADLLPPGATVRENILRIWAGKLEQGISDPQPNPTGGADNDGFPD